MRFVALAPVGRGESEPAEERADGTRHRLYVVVVPAAGRPGGRGPVAVGPGAGRRGEVHAPPPDRGVVHVVLARNRAVVRAVVVVIRGRVDRAFKRALVVVAPVPAEVVVLEGLGDRAGGTGALLGLRPGHSREALPVGVGGVLVGVDGCHFLLCLVGPAADLLAAAPAGAELAEDAPLRGPAQAAPGRRTAAGPARRLAPVLAAPERGQDGVYLPHLDPGLGLGRASVSTDLPLHLVPERALGVIVAAAPVDVRRVLRDRIREGPGAVGIGRGLDERPVVGALVAAAPRGPELDTPQHALGRQRRGHGLGRRLVPEAQGGEAGGRRRVLRVAVVGVQALGGVVRGDGGVVVEARPALV